MVASITVNAGEPPSSGKFVPRCELILGLSPTLRASGADLRILESSWGSRLGVGEKARNRFHPERLWGWGPAIRLGMQDVLQIEIYLKAIGLELLDAEAKLLATTAPSEQLYTQTLFNRFLKALRRILENYEILSTFSFEAQKDLTGEFLYMEVTYLKRMILATFRELAEHTSLNYEFRVLEEFRWDAGPLRRSNDDSRLEDGIRVISENDGGEPTYWVFDRELYLRLDKDRFPLLPRQPEDWKDVDFRNVLRTAPLDHRNEAGGEHLDFPTYKSRGVRPGDTIAIPSPPAGP